MMGITASNNDLIIEEYPFLKRFVDKTLRSISVSVVDFDLLRVEVDYQSVLKVEAEFWNNFLQIILEYPLYQNLDRV